MKNTALVLSALIYAGSTAQGHEPKYSAKIPPSITTPDTVQTRIGTLKFFDGLPDAETVRKAYDQVDFGRGVEAFLSGIPAASVHAMCNGLEEIGAKANQAIGVTENLMDARSLFLTPNSTNVYNFFCIDVKNGPVVLEVPPAILGMVDGAYFRFVTDISFTGPDQGKGAKYLFVPPGYTGTPPADGYVVTKTPTYMNLIIFRAFVRNDDIPAAVKHVKDTARVYPLSAAANPPPTTFVDISGKQFNTIHSNSFKFYEEINDVIQYEPGDAFDPEIVGLFAAIGIKKGQPFAPDERLKAILVDAVAVGNAAARAIVFATRGFGSAYAFTSRDANGAFLDGSKTYKITLPAPIPAGEFWSFTVYDAQTRSMLETDQKLAGIDSNPKSIKLDADGSYTIWFGPKAPDGHETNWVQTWPGKSWQVILRLYSPLQAWFDKSWKPGDLVEIK
jgi:hypothetical protein